MIKRKLYKARGIYAYLKNNIISDLPSPPMYDTDAFIYMAAVETADGESLELAVKDAINTFVVGCKADGIWEAIKASCIMAGARTLGGALIPLKGAAPTNFNFISADYNRKTGLKGDGVNKYLDTNFFLTAPYQNNVHSAVWRTEVEGTNTEGLLGNTSLSSGLQISTNASNRVYRANSSNSEISDNSRHLGFVGITRNSAPDFTYRYNQINNLITSTSLVVESADITVFSRGGVDFTSARMPFYSIGESLDLALLSSRVETFLNVLNVIL